METLKTQNRRLTEVLGMTSWLKNRNLRELIAGACSLVFGAMTLALLILDRSASAAVSAAMTGASVFALILPFVDTIEAFGLKAKLVRQIDEGEVLLTQLKETVAVLAKPVFLQAAFGNRWDGIPTDLQRTNLDEVVGMLKKVGVSQKAIDESRAPVPAMQSWDFFFVVTHTIRLLINEKLAKVESAWKDKNQNKPLRMDDPGYKAYLQKSEFLRNCIPKNHPRPPLEELRDIRPLIKAAITSAELRDADEKMLNIVAEEAIRYSTECWENGFITDEGSVYLEKYQSNQDKRFIELKEANADWDASWFDPPQPRG